MASRCALGAGCILTLLAAGSIQAAGSDVADAVKKGDLPAVRSLLAQKADVNAPQPDGDTALHWAVWRENVELTGLLLHAGANPNVVNRTGSSPMSLASGSGNAAILELLLKAGVDPNAPLSKYGDTPLMLAARTGKADAVRLLLDHGADVNARETWGGTNALMWAASEKHPAVVQMLVARGADLNARSKIVPAPQRRGDGNMKGFVPRDYQPGEKPESLVKGRDLNIVLPSGGLTPLMFSAREGDLESARILVTAGANLNAAAGDLSTALGLAIQNGYYELASFLIDKGADVNQSDVLECSPLFLAVHVRNEDTSVGIPWIVTADALPVIQKLLDKGADPNHRVKFTPPFRKNNASSGSPWLDYEGATPFLRAAAAGDMVGMRLLLKYGADPNIPTTHGLTALGAAAGIGYMGGMSKEWSRQQRVEAVKFLLDLGLSVDATDSVGRTPLHGAAALGYPEVVQLLVDHGARLDAKDKGGSVDSTEPLIPLDYAIGVRLFTAASPVHQPETQALLEKLMAERGIVHSTSECTLKGFTCGDKSPRKRSADR
ncbi:MAG TPA: ankyrin repeat domain-containing protein [Bryobacteraceae bacterium]|nr:ankyrin repeat domain-containing protein [Bryobacteraceae bacterium]